MPGTKPLCSTVCFATSSVLPMAPGTKRAAGLEQHRRCVCMSEQAHLGRPASDELPAPLGQKDRQEGERLQIGYACAPVAVRCLNCQRRKQHMTCSTSFALVLRMGHWNRWNHIFRELKAEEEPFLRNQSGIGTIQSAGTDTRRGPLLPEATSQPKTRMARSTPHAQALSCWKVRKQYFGNGHFELQCTREMHMFQRIGTSLTFVRVRNVRDQTWSVTQC